MQAKGKAKWLCKCSCGEEVSVTASNLTRGQTKSCGCFRKAHAASIKKREEIIGQKFGRLTVVSMAERKHKQCRYNCVCECGGKTVSYAASLRNGQSRSCGCLRLEVNKVHGELARAAAAERRNESIEKWSERPGEQNAD